MACYWPIPALQTGPQGPVQLWPPQGAANQQLPCGKCIGCRTDRATQWAARCQHEASQWEANSFLTLTYDDNHVPPEGHLDARALQLFIKRLRKHAESHKSMVHRDRTSGIRFFACGEYGSTTQRPHYHALLFNCGFTDLKKVGKDLYESATVQELWPDGSNRIGLATAASANYIAQYNIKKQGQGNHDPDGVWRPAPFLRMSLRPAIGNEWLKTYAADLRHGYLITKEARKQTVPRHYRNTLKKINSDLHEEMEANSYNTRLNHPTDKGTPERLRDAETIHKRRAELYNNRT